MTPPASDKSVKGGSSDEASRSSRSARLYRGRSLESLFSQFDSLRLSTDETDDNALPPYSATTDSRQQASPPSFEKLSAVAQTTKDDSREFLHPSETRNDYTQQMFAYACRIVVLQAIGKPTAFGRTVSLRDAVANFDAFERQKLSKSHLEYMRDCAMKEDNGPLLDVARIFLTHGGEEWPIHVRKGIEKLQSEAQTVKKEG